MPGGPRGGGNSIEGGATTEKVLFLVVPSLASLIDGTTNRASPGDRSTREGLVSTLIGHCVSLPVLDLASSEANHWLTQDVALKIIIKGLELIHKAWLVAI